MKLDFGKNHVQIYRNSWRDFSVNRSLAANCGATAGNARRIFPDYDAKRPRPGLTSEEDERMTQIEVWHFLPDNGYLAHDRRRVKVEVGKTYRVKPPLIMCGHGLHGSVRAIDALKYAPGALVTRCVLSGEILTDADKCCASERTVLWMADATRTLHEFGCDVAEDALRLIRNPDSRSIAAIETKRRWLKGEASDDELATARDAAWAAAWAAPRPAARDAAWYAARDGAWYAAWDAGDAAWYAARDAAGTAAGDKYNDWLIARLVALKQ